MHQRSRTRSVARLQARQGLQLRGAPVPGALCVDVRDAPDSAEMKYSGTARDIGNDASVACRRLNDTQQARVADERLCDQTRSRDSQLLACSTSAMFRIERIASVGSDLCTLLSQDAQVLEPWTCRHIASRRWARAVSATRPGGVGCHAVRVSSAQLSAERWDDGLVCIAVEDAGSRLARDARRLRQTSRLLRTCHAGDSGKKILGARACYHPAAGKNLGARDCISCSSHRWSLCTRTAQHRLQRLAVNLCPSIAVPVQTLGPTWNSERRCHPTTLG